MVLNVHRNRTAYYGWGEGGEGFMEVGERENEPQPDIPVLFFFSDGVYKKQLALPLAFFHALTLSFSDIQNNNT